MKMHHKNIISIFSLIISALLLTSAYTLEYFLNLAPCDLCMKQRYIHFGILSDSIITYIFFKTFKLNFILIFILPILWLLSFLTSFYHHGIEKKLWLGFSSCESNIRFGKETLSEILKTNPVNCGIPQFEILSLSLAGWNAIFSLSVFIIIILFLLKIRGVY